MTRGLGRRKEHDPRSKAWPARGVLFADDSPLRSKTWPCSLYLDQGRTPTCVGNAFAHELAAVPVAVPDLNEDFAQALYHRAQELDEWPGESYEGTSGLAGAKAVTELGYYSEYRHAFGVDQALQALSHTGPVPIGIPWLESMFDPRPSGLLEVTGNEAGGHEILARGHLLKARLKGEKGTLHVVRFRNSWGRSWGVNGDCYMRVEDLDSLLKRDGDVIVPVRTSKR